MCTVIDYAAFGFKKHSFSVVFACTEQILCCTLGKERATGFQIIMNRMGNDWGKGDTDIPMMLLPPPACLMHQVTNISSGHLNLKRLAAPLSAASRDSCQNPYKKNQIQVLSEPSSELAWKEPHLARYTFGKTVKNSDWQPSFTALCCASAPIM